MCGSAGTCSLPPSSPTAISCTVDKHTSILAITFTTECSDKEEDPFFGRTPKARAACAREGDAGITVNEVGIDGKVYDVNRYRTLSPDLRVRLPEDDLFGVPTRASAALHRSDGWATP